MKGYIPDSSKCLLYFETQAVIIDRLKSSGKFPCIIYAIIFIYLHDLNHTLMRAKSYLLSVHLSVRDVSCLAIGDNCVISNKVQNAIITICQTFVRQILFKDILETIHFLTFLVFITVFPTIVCNFAREIHLLRRDTPICRTNPLSSTKPFPNDFLVDLHYIPPNPLIYKG